MSPSNKTRLFSQTFDARLLYRYKNIIDFRYNVNGASFLGFIIRKKYGNAVSRNRLKRVSRHLFLKIFMDNNVSIIIKPLCQNIAPVLLQKAFDDFKQTKLC